MGYNFPIVCRLLQWQRRNSIKTVYWGQIGGSDFADGHLRHDQVKKYYQSAGEDPTMTSDIVGRPPTNQYCGGGGGGVVPCFLSDTRRMRGAESRALATVLLQRAGGRRRRREEGVALNDGGRPGSFNDERKVDALLHHPGYRLRLWTLTFGYPLCPLCLPLHPAWEEGAIARGGLLLLSPPRATGMRTDIVDDDPLPPLAFCTLRCTFCLTSRYWLEFYYPQGISGESTNDRNHDTKGVTTRFPLPAPSGDDNAAPPDHLLRSRRCWGGNVAVPALRSCQGVDDGKEGDGGVGHAMELSGARLPRCGGVEERHWGCGLLGVALPGQEGNSIRLKQGSDNQHVVGWGCVAMHGGGGRHGICQGGHCCDSARRRL